MGENNIDNLWEIEIERNKETNEYTFKIDNPNKGIRFKKTAQIQEKTRKKVLNTLDKCFSVLSMARSKSPEKVPDLFEEEDVAPEQVGELIHNYMIPEKCLDKLERIDSDYVRISTDDLEIPWELIYDGEEFFSLKNSVGRTITTSREPEKEERPNSSKIRTLLIGDPECNLEGARKEVKILEKKFSSRNGIEVDTLIGDDANYDNLLFNYLDNYYDIIHYAGHTKYKGENPEKSKIRLHDGKITGETLSSFKFLNPPPKLVFLNSCESSSSSEVEYWEEEGKVTGLATTFVSSGVDNYIGTLWPIKDQISHTLAREFYEKVLKGNPVGFSLKRAKLEAIEEWKDYLSPSSFILYGDPRNSYNIKTPSKRDSVSDFLRWLLSKKGKN